MAGNVSIKLRIDGAAEAKAVLENFSQFGSAATAKLRSSLEGLASGDVGGRFADSLAGAAAKVAAAQRALAAVPPGDTSALTAAQQKVTAATDAYTSALQRKRAAIVPAAAAEQSLARTISDVTAAERLGAISATEAAAARARAHTGYDKTILSMKEVSTTSGAAAANMRGLGIQAIQGFSGIATGQPILTTLIQQGHQVVDQSLAMGTGFGGIATAAKGLFAAVGGLPVLLGGAVVGGLVAVGAAANENANRLGDLRQSLRLTHDDYAALADTVDASAKRVAASSNLTRTAAEDIGKSIASSRYLGSFAGDLDGLTKAAANYARVAGVDGAAAGKLFRQAIDDPAAAAASLAAQGLPAMTTALLRTITTLDASGERGKAAAMVIDTLRTSTKGAAEDVSPLSKAMTGLSNAFSTAGANGKSFASEIGTFVTNDLAEFLSEITDLVHKAQALRDWVGSKGSSAVIDASTGKATNGITLPDGLSNKVYAIAEANRISPEIADLATRIIGQGEHSSGQYAANGSVLTSPKGAQGLMQLMPATAAGQDINPGGKLDPTKLDDNVLLGLRYLAQLGETFHGNEQQIAAAYNAGPGRLTDVLNGKATLPDETAKYVKNVTGSPFAASSAASSGSVALPTIAVTASKSPESVERALAPFTKLGSEGTPEATQAAASADIAKYTAAINDLKAAGESTGPTMDRLQQLLAKARGEFANAIGPIDSVTRGLTDQLAPLLAESGAARAVAEAINQQVLAARGAGRTVTDGQAEAAKAAVLHNLAAAFNDVVASTDRTTAANLRIVGTLDQGAPSFLQATNREKALAQARDDFLPGPEQVAAVERYTAALNGQSASAADLASVQKAFDQRDQLAILQLETTSLGQNADLRDKEIALLQTKQALIKQGADLDSDASKANLANVAAISSASAALKGQEASLNELTGFVDNTFSTISDSIVSAFATGEQSAVKFKDVAASVVKAVEAEFIKLALINPLKNLLLGTSSPDLLSVGGIAGKLLGNSGVGAATTVGGGSFGSAGIELGSGGGGGGFDSPLALVGAAGSVAKLGDTLGLTGSSGTGGGILVGLADKITGAITNGFGNAAEATNIALAGAGQGVSGVATATEVGAASIANGIGASNTLAASISSAASSVASALPYIGTAISVVTGIISGDYRGAAITAGTAAIGAYVGSIIATPGIGTAIGAAVGTLIGAFLPNHPKHPFEDVELNVSGGRLATGKSDGQLADVAGLVAGTKNYVDNINGYLDSVGVKISTADGNIGRIGQGITGLAQTLDPSTTFKRLDFANANTNDRSNFSIAKDALLGMKFDTPQALSDELAKIAGFADVPTPLGIPLASVGRDITNLQIASVSGSNPGATSTVTDGSGLTVTFLSDLRTALSADLPKQSYADTAALDAEMQKVSNFITGTLPSLLTPMKVTQSTVQDQYNAIRRQYDGAEQQSRAYGLNNDGVLNDAMNRALNILMEPVTRGLNTAMAAVAGRFNTLALGTSGSGKATNDNLAYTQLNERAALDDSWRQAWGDSVTASDAYKNALKQLVDTQNLEAQATREQIALQQEQGLASIKATEADFAKRAGFDSLSQQLSAYDTKAAVETDTFIASWRAYYGEYSAVGTDFQNQMIALWNAHYNERLQIETDYATTSNTASSAALKTAQGSVTTLFGSLKDYALKLQTGSQSALSPTAQYDLAKTQFQAVAGAAQAGDANSASQLTVYADALLTTSRAMFDTGVGYANDYKSVLDAIQGVSMVPDSLTQNFVTQNTQSQTATLVQTLQDNTTSLKNELAALRREMQGLSRQMAS